MAVVKDEYPGWTVVTDGMKLKVGDGTTDEKILILNGGS